MTKLTLEEWFAGSVDDRQSWLETGRELDQTSHLVLGWALTFKDHGGHISQETILSVYRARINGFTVAA